MEYAENKNGKKNILTQCTAKVWNKYGAFQCVFRAGPLFLCKKCLMYLVRTHGYHQENLNGVASDFYGAKSKFKSPDFDFLSILIF